MKEYFVFLYNLGRGKKKGKWWISFGIFVGLNLAEVYYLRVSPTLLSLNTLMTYLVSWFIMANIVYWQIRSKPESSP